MGDVNSFIGETGVRSQESGVRRKAVDVCFYGMGAKTLAMSIYRENRIQKSGVRIQEKSGSCLFSWMGATPPS